MIQPEFANQPDFIRRFETEAQLVAQLEHLHIVPLYDYWRDPDGAYLAMRYLKGGSLEALIGNGSLSLTRTAHLFEQIISALAAAHRKGIVHRDLKPANILLDEDGNAYLSDFGIAKAIGAQSGMTITGAIVGTPTYISPEQIQALPVSPQTDIYSLGVLLFVILTGKHTFPDASAGDLFARHLRDPLPDIKESAPDLPAEVDSVIQRATAKDPADRYPDVGSLLADFRQALGPDLIPSPEWRLSEELLDVPNPYKGLRPFQEADAADFFGREALIEQLLTRLREDNEYSRFLAVVGPSGSGKSSVVKAGLLPALRQGAMPGSQDWFMVAITPGTHPLDELEVGLLRIAAQKPTNLMEQLKRDERGLVRAGQLILPEGNGELLLVIDQFEEIFTLAEDKTEADHFMGLIFRAVTDPHSQIRVLITLRADFYDRPLMEADFSTLVQQRTEVVIPLSSAELESAITAPGARIGMALEPGLETEIIADVIDQPGSLPLLQYALTELFERRQGRLLTREKYQAIGGVLGALASQAEQVYLSLNEIQQAVSRQIFLRLVALGEGVEDTRRRVLRSELTSLADLLPGNMDSKSGAMGSDKSDGLIETVLETFGKARLLSFDHDPLSRAPTVEVAHEALLREWLRLKEWLVDSRADIRLERLLSNAVAEWEQGSRDPSFLLGGSRLAQFEGWAEHTSLALTEGEMLFLQASLLHEAERQAHEAALERRSRNFLRGLVGVFALATVVAVVLSVFALTARNQARSEADARATQQAIAEQEARARATAEAVAVAQTEQVFRQASVRLADDALGQIELGRPDRAVLLMIAALEEYPYTPQAENALARSVVEIADTRLFIEAGNVDWSAVAWSPTGDRVATAIYGKVSGSESYILIQDPQSGAEILSINLGDSCLDPSNVIWSPSGDRLITIPQFCDEAPNVWDAGTGKLLTTLDSQPDQAAFSAAWSPDGGSILTGSLDGSARVWDSQSGALRRVIPAHSDYIRRVAWAPSGAQLATASDDNTAKIWEAATGELLHELSRHTDNVAGVAWSPDGEKIVTASLDATALVWDATSGEMLFPLKGHDDLVWDVAWSPDGGYIASDSRDGTARIWDAASGVELFRFRNNQAGESVLNSIDWSPLGDQLLTMGSIYNQIWDLSTQPANLFGHLEGLKAARYSPDGERIATASLDGTARIWDDASGESLGTLVHQGVEDLAWSPDGSRLVTSSQDGVKGVVRVWQVDTGTSSELPNPDKHRFSSLSWSPGGDRIVASSQRDLVSVIWDVDTGERTVLDQGDLICYLASPSWSPEGDRFVTGCVRREVKDTPARIWDPETGGELMRLESEDGNSLVVEWSPDGISIAVAYSEMIIRTWDVESSLPQIRFSGHSDIIADLSWSPNSRRIVSADGGGFARAWDAGSGDEIRSFKLTNTLNSVDWSPDGEQVILATLDPEPKIFRVWQSMNDLIRYAEGCCVWRELSIGERQQFGLPQQ